ncbi:MAG TPA: polysaccharide biosynthesis C-terminal domain-containing protein [archaeon]|nr:polysaccharide biosynthesis C-terminal domain-containing protein [archaeon]
MEATNVKRTTRGTVYVSIETALNFLAGLIFYVIAARILPTADIGGLTALTFIFTIVPVTAELALPTAAAKYMSEFIGRGETDKAAAVSAAVKKIVLITSLVSLFLVAILSTWFSHLVWGDASHAQIFLILSVALFLTTIRATYLGFLQGLQSYGKYSLVGFFAYALARVAAVILVVMGYGLTGVMVGWLIGEVVGLPLTIALFYGFLPKPTTTFDMKTLFSFSLPLFALLFVTTASDWTDRMLFFSISRNLSNLGVYDLAVRGATTLSIFYIAFSTIVLPTFSEIHGRSGRKPITRTLKTSLRYLTYLILPAGFGLAAISKTAMALMFGPSYVAIGRLPLAILALATFFIAIGTVFSSTLQAIGETRVFIMISLAAIVADILVIIIAVPFFGVVGASFGRITLWAVLFALTYIALNKRVRVEFDKESLWKGMVSSVIMAAILLGFEFTYATSFSPGFDAVIEIISGAIIYGICLFALNGLHKRDFEILMHTAPTFSHKILKRFERFFTR